MKKMLIVMSLVVMLVSCKSNSPVGTKLDMKTEVALKGNWSISSVDYPGSEYIKVTSFNIEDSQCFVGSEWSFVSNFDSIIAISCGLSENSMICALE